VTQGRTGRTSARSDAGKDHLMPQPESPDDRLRAQSERQIKRREIRSAYLFLAPYLALLCMFGLFPVIYAFGLSFFDTIEGVFWGLTNYTSVLSDFRLPRSTVNVLTLIAMITPSTAVVLPIFLQMHLLGLTNTYAGFILASGFFPFGVYLAYIYFSTSLPKGVMDSARVDGCTRAQLFTRIALPLAKPAMALVAFFSFLGIWSNYFLAFVLLSDDALYNLPVGLTTLVSGSGALSNLPTEGIPIKKPEVILAAILVALPVMLIFLFAQGRVRSGLLTGAEKG